MNSQESAEMYLETILILEKKNGNVRILGIVKLLIIKSLIIKSLTRLQKILYQ